MFQMETSSPGTPSVAVTRERRYFFFFFFTLVTGPSRSLSLKLSDTRVYERGVTLQLYHAYCAIGAWLRSTEKEKESLIFPDP